MRTRGRKTTPRVKNGRVQRKNFRDARVPEDGPLVVLTDVPGPGYRHVVTRDQVLKFISIVHDWERASTGLRAIILNDGDNNYDGRYEDGVIELSPWCDPPETTVNPWYFTAHREIWRRLGVPWRPAPDFITEIIAARDEDPTRGRVRDVLGDLLAYGRHAVEPGELEGELCVRDEETPGRPRVYDLVPVGRDLHVYERCVHVGFTRKTAAAYQLLHVFLHELGHHVDAQARPSRGACVRGEDYAETWSLRAASRIWDVYFERFS